MRSFYHFKLFQCVVTFVLLFNLMSFDFCGKFVAPQCFLKSAVPTGRCHYFSIFGEQFEKDEDNAFTMAELSTTKNLFEKANATDDEKYMECVTSRLPTGDRCLPLRISFVTSFKNEYYGIKSDLLNQTAELLAIVQFYGFLFVIMILLNVMTKQSSGYCASFLNYFCVVYGVVIWVHSTAIAARLSLSWTAHWECTNFVPNSSPVLLTVLIISIVLMCSSLFELLCFDHSLLKSIDNLAKTHAKICSAKLKEVLVKANVKNGELSDV